MANPRRSFEFRLLDQVDKIRLVLVAFFVAVLFLVPRESVAYYRFAAIILSLTATYTLITHFLLDWQSVRREGRIHLMAAILVCADVLWITVFLYALGPAFSGLSSLLLLDVVFAATFFTGFELALVVLISCGCVALLGISAGEATAAWQTATTTGAMVVVGWLAYVLSEVARQERAANTRIVQHLTEGVLLVAEGGVLAVVNPRIEQMVGVRAADVVGLSVFDPKNAPQLEPLMDLLTDVTSPPSSQYEITTRHLHIEHPNPMDLQVLTVPCAQRRGRVVSWVVVCRDVTDMLGTVRCNEDGTPSVSQELRSRLLTVRAASEVLIRMADNLSPADRNWTFRVLDTETRRLSRLIARTLDSANVEDESTPFHFEPVKVETIAREACDCLRPVANEKGISLMIETPGGTPLVSADPSRLDQVFQNLIENAIKFTPRGGKVTVRVAPDTDSGGVRVSVSDTGPGIPPDRINVIFEKFVHGAREVDPHVPPGLGLGLHLCRQIVRRHGGTIGVDSVEGRGATFWFVLPPQQPPPTPFPPRLQGTSTCPQAKPGAT